jgi:hypothetical protein
MGMLSAQRVDSLLNFKPFFAVSNQAASIRAGASDATARPVGALVTLIDVGH